MSLPLRCLPSRHLLRALLGLHLLAATALFLGDLPVWPRWAGVFALAASAAFHLRRREATNLRLESDGILLLRTGADEWRPAAVLAQTAVSPWLCVLRYRLEGERRSRSLAVLPDCLPADDFRRLRVWLRWRAAVDASVTPEPAAAPSGTPPPGSPG